MAGGLISRCRSHLHPGCHKFATRAPYRRREEPTLGPSSSGLPPDQVGTRRSIRKHSDEIGLLRPVAIGRRAGRCACLCVESKPKLKAGRQRGCSGRLGCDAEPNPASQQRGHSMTSSAVASNVGEMLSPRALAVLRLTTTWNFIGCSTGSSPGFAPLRILSM